MMLVARLLESLLPKCPNCGADMRIVALITEASRMQRIHDFPLASHQHHRRSPRCEDRRQRETRIDAGNVTSGQTRRPAAAGV